MRPMLDDLELPQVQEIATYDQRMLAEHKPPGKAGSLLQNMGRRSTQLVLWGVASGADAQKFVEQLDAKFRAGDPVPFSADIVADAVARVVSTPDLAQQMRTRGRSRAEHFSLDNTRRAWTEVIEATIGAAR